jgi:hypothetical protein
MLMEGASPEQLLKRCAQDERAFRQRRKPFLMYQ